MKNQLGTYGIFNSKGYLIEEFRTKKVAEIRKRILEKIFLNMEDFKIKKLKNQLRITL